MASSTSPLFKASSSPSTEDQAHIARTLIAANELYKISNSADYSLKERKQARQESESLVRETLKQVPECASALNLLARIDLDNADIDSAEALLIKALEIEPSHINTKMNYAYVLIAKRDYAAAEQQFQEILALDAGSHQAFSGIALSKLRRKDYLGAFQHYRRLLELGFQNPAIESYFLESIEFLSCDHYDPALEALLLQCFGWDDVDHAKLSAMAGSLVIAKYDLNNDQAILELDTLLADEFLLQVIEHCLLKSVELESLVAELRRSILTEVAMTQSLRDTLLPFALALGIYSARVDHVLMITEEEENQIVQIQHQIRNTCSGRWEQEDLAGALIIVSMYESLYSQSFSHHLLKYSLEEWPVGMQSLLRASLYDLCDEHQFYFDLFGNDSSRLLNDEIDRAADRWSGFPALGQTNIFAALSAELGTQNVPARFEESGVKILLVGCGSGQRAFYLSQYFTNVDVYAVDSSRSNIAYAQLKARQHGIYDVHFIHAEYDTALLSEESFDIIEFGEAINHVPSPADTIREWKSLLAEDGLMRFSFNTLASQEVASVIIQLVRDRGLSPTTDNVRHLRNAIAQEAKSGLWDALFSDERFYTGTGCKDLFFHSANHYFDLQGIHSIIQENKLEFVGFADLSDKVKDECNTLAPYNLLAWHVMDQDQALFKHAYQLYCRKQ